MNCIESAVQIPCAEQDMLGILSLPPKGVQRHTTAVLIVVGGAQYRTGSHRQFVLLARRLATQGFPVLRFDMRGMGDTPGPACNFENCSTDIAAAVDVLPGLAPGTEHVVLWGLCDGASASLLYVEATQDPRVAGLCLLNPWVRSETSLARTHVKHYYRQRLLDAAFWRKLVAGGVRWRSLTDLAASLRKGFARQKPRQRARLLFQDRMVLGWQAFAGPVLVLLSERDLTANEFVDLSRNDPGWQRCMEKPGTRSHTLLEADHTLTACAAREQMEEIVRQWLTEATVRQRARG